MASNYVSKAKEKRKADKDYRKVMTSRQAYAMENARLRAAELSSPSVPEKKSVKYSNNADQLVGGKIEGTEIDASFAADIQKMKFCRKPVGFLMWLLYLVLLVVLAVPFVLPHIPMELPIDVNQYVAVCLETEVKQSADAPEDENAEDEAEGEEDADAENASAYSLLGADEDAAEESDESAEGEDEEEGEEAAATATFDGTVYSLSDPLFGWIKFIGSKVGMDIELGESPWYDTQISKTEVGMTDTIAPIIIMAYPPFIIVYVLLTFVLMLQTLICFASNDRRIFRFTGIESLALLVCGGVIMLGCFASATEIDAAMDFSGIVNFLIGSITQTGGFTAGYGMLAMLGVPVIGFILSFFLLEKKLRGREITQPIVVYHYKEK